MKRKINNNFVSIIIPAFNEMKTLPRVLSSVQKNKVDEIIIVNDGSTDSITDFIRLRQIQDKRINFLDFKINRGAGAARKEGIKISFGNIIICFDADIQNSTPMMIKRLLRPIIDNEADFALANFSNFGRVTEFSVRPLLRIFLPELAKLGQPLSGQFTAKREYLFPEKMEDGYCMLGVLIDAFLAGARIKEVNIGPLKHDKRDDKEKTNQALSNIRAFFGRLKEAGLAQW